MLSLRIWLCVPYNQYFVDYEISGEIVCELPLWHKDDNPIMMNGHKPEEVDDYLSRVTDYSGGGMYGNIDSMYVLLMSVCLNIYV